MAAPKKKRKSRIPKIKLPLQTNRNQMPGAVTYIGKKSTAITKLEIIDFSADHYTRVDTEDIEEAFKFEASEHVTWVNVNGLNDTSIIEKLGNYYDLHPLIQEDIVSTNQRPKIDEYEDYLFIVFKMLYYNDKGDLENEHVSMVVGKNYLTTFQEADGDVFDSVRERLENAKGRIRTKHSDYLMFALLDAVVDNYFSVIEIMSDKIESLEDQLFDTRDGNNDDITLDIQDLKKEILRIRRATLPLREVVNRLEKSGNTIIDESTLKYIRDLYDHIIQVNESVEVYREMIWGLMDMYMTTISNRMNEVMKVLTIMASIFIPLTFMAGIYGMNFDNIPELHYENGYFYLLGAMALVFLAMLWYFKRKKWL